MQAAVYERYGPPDVVRIRDVPTPVPRAGELLVRVHATTVTAGDWRLRSLDVPPGFKTLTRLVFGIRRPRQPILGMELAGVVEAVGPGPARFAPGDAVFAFADTDLGGHAEFACLKPRAHVARKPATLDFGSAAALSFGGTTALDFLRKGRLARGESVLVNGASGSVGSAMVQLARHAGAEVTAVCSGANADWVRALGAVRVIDHTQQDFTQGGGPWDVIVDAAGTAPYARCRRVLKPGGRLLLVTAGLPQLLRAPWVGLTSRHRVVAGVAMARDGDLAHLAALAEAGHFRPVIGRRVPFARIAEAHAWVDSRRKRGNVVVDLLPDG